MDKWFIEVNKLAKENLNLEFILPLHPNPNVQKHKHLLPNINVVKPLSHSELLKILTQSKLVISDSGGIQEESSFFNKKVIVCRKTTERPEAINTGHLLLCPSPDKLNLNFEKLKNNYYINEVCPYGDGESSIKIKNLI